MIKTVMLATLFAVLLGARENPFFPATGIEELPVTTNIAEERQPLKRAAISLPDSARILKGVTLQFQNLDGTLETRYIELDHTVDWHLPVFVSQSYTQTQQAEQPAAPEAKPRPVEVANFGFIRFAVLGKTLTISGSDPMLRNFKLVDPHRVVVDFKAERNFRSHDKRLKEAPFQRIRIGNHDGYYRVVIELDGQYRTRIGTTQTGITLECL